MRNVRKLGSKLKNLEEFTNQANEAFEEISKSIHDIEVVIAEMVKRLEILEEYVLPAKQKSKKKDEVENA
jgi:hypothetical protein